MSDKSFKTYAGVIGFIMRKGADIVADRFEKRLTELLKKANRDDKVTLTTIAFYIILILLVYLLIFFGAVVFGNFKVIHSESLSEFIFWISLFWTIWMVLFIWLRKRLWQIISYIVWGITYKLKQNKLIFCYVYY